MREAFVAQLEAYGATVGGQEKQFVETTLDFVRREVDAFERKHEAGGHVGPSAVVVSPDFQNILMAGHTVMKVYAFFGNHCEGRLDMPEVARERVRKDAGNAVAKAIVSDGRIFDVDIHDVPAHDRKGEMVPEHVHYDVAYLFTMAPDFEVEMPNAKWFKLEDVVAADEQQVRILQKLQGLR